MSIQRTDAEEGDRDTNDHAPQPDACGGHQKNKSGSADDDDRPRDCEPIRADPSPRSSRDDGADHDSDTRHAERDAEDVRVQTELPLIHERRASDVGPEEEATPNGFGYQGPLER